jgi:hypothetical protein
MAAALLGPSVASALASTDASPVVTVAGSVSTVMGTVSLSTGTVQAVASAIASNLPAPASVTSVTLGPDDERALGALGIVCLIGMFLLSVIAVAVVCGVAS